MDSRDLRNLAEAWENIVNPEVEQLDEQGGRGGVRAAEVRRQQQQAAQAKSAKQALQQGKTLDVAGNFGLQTGTKVKMDSAATRQQGRTVVRATHSPNISNPLNKIQLGGQTMYRAQLGGKDVYVGAKPVKPTTSTATTPVKPTTPTATTPVRPAAPAAPAAKTAPTAASTTTTPASPAPAPKTSNPLLKDNSISDMIKASQMRQRGANVTSDNIASVRQSVQQANRPEVLNRPAPAGSALARQQQAQGSTVSGSGASGSAANQQVRAQLGMKPINPAPAPRPVPVANPTAKITPISQKKRQPPIDPKTGTGAPRGEDIFAGVDLFDIVKGHLMSEGYADTEEAALAIMANMSEEWKQSIVEADSVEAMRARAAKRREQRYGKQGGGGRDDYRPYTEDDYKKPGSGASSQAKDA